MPCKRLPSVALLLVLLAVPSYAGAEDALTGAPAGRSISPTTSPMPGESGSASRGAIFYTRDSLALTLTDSSRVNGTLIGTVPIEPEQYGPRYERWRATAPAGAELPAFGERVSLVGSGIMSVGDGTFQGFALDGIAVGRGRHGVIRTEPFRDFSVMITRGRRVGVKQLERLRTSGGVPLTSALQLATSTGPRSIPLDEVAWVETRDLSYRVPASLSQFVPAGTASSLASGELGQLWVRDASSGNVTFVFDRLRNSAPGFEGRWTILRGGILVDLDLVGAMPLLKVVTLIPKCGLGIGVGGQVAAVTANAGAALLVELAPGFGVRVDYTRFGFISSSGSAAIHSISVGPCWGLQGLHHR